MKRTEVKLVTGLPPHQLYNENDLQSAYKQGISVQLASCEKELKVIIKRNYQMGFNDGKAEVQKAREEERKQTLRELRDIWTWEAAHGHPCYSVDLDRWIRFCREAGITDDWWELKLDEEVSDAQQ